LISDFEQLAGFTATSIDLSSATGTPDGDAIPRPQRHKGALFTPGVFEALRVQPILGRTFRDEEERPGAEPAIILGYDIWQSRFSGERDILGKSVVANGVSRTIVGVMPQGFLFPNAERLWLPLEIDPSAYERGEGPRFSVIGRLRDGVSESQAEARLAAVAAGLEEAYPESNEGVRPTLMTLKQALVPGAYYGLFYSMVGAAFGVLLIGCVNVANLLLARATARAQEVAVRSALGAGRCRLMMLMLTEVSMLAIIGGGIGFVLGHLGLQWFLAQMNYVLANAGGGEELPFWISFEHDLRVVLFVAFATALASVLAGVLPALRASATNVAEAMKGAGRGAAGPRENVYTARVRLPEAGYADAASRLGFFERLLPELRGIPGVESATLSDSLPPFRVGAWTIEVEGEVYLADTDYPIVRRGIIAPDYFRTFEAPILHGRALSAEDRSDTAPVAVVNEALARAYFSEGGALGRRFRVRNADSAASWLTVVGVVPDLKAFPMGADGVSELAQSPACFYVPMAQTEPSHYAVMVLRTQMPPTTIAGDVRNVVASIDSQLPLFRELSMDGVILRMTWFYPVFSTLFTAFGFGALFLAAVGLYGVMSFAVTQRTREMGVRMALGAQRGQLVALVMRKGIVRIGIGLGIGLVLAMLAATPLGILLFEVQGRDPAVFGLVVLTLAVTGIVAILVPARRVTRVDPSAALGSE